VGANWEPAGFGGGSYYARTLVINPANPSELFAGFWDWDPVSNPQFGGVWHTTKAPTASQTSDWSPMAGFPTSTGPVTGTVADLKIIGGYLYAACPTLGIFRHQLGGSGWTSLNGGPVSTVGGQLWTSLDGYVDQASQDHVIIAACGNGVKGSNNYTNVVRITIAPDRTVTPVDLTGSATIDLQKMPPGDQTWWRYNTSFANWLGGSAFVNPHVLVDPNAPSRVYLAGSGGFYRTRNAGADAASVKWTIASNGMPMSSAFVIAVDPGNPSHVVLASADFTQTDLTDPTGWDTSTVTSVTMPDSHRKPRHRVRSCLQHLHRREHQVWAERRRRGVLAPPRRKQLHLARHRLQRDTGQGTENLVRSCQRPYGHLRRGRWQHPLHRGGDPGR